MAIKIEAGKKYYTTFAGDIVVAKCVALTENGGLFNLGWSNAWLLVERNRVLAEKPPLFSWFKSKTGSGGP